MTRRRTKPYQGRIVHQCVRDTITEVQSEQIRSIYSNIGRFCFRDQQFERFEFKFLSLEKLDAEIEWWLAVASVFQKCITRFPDADAYDAATALCYHSLGVTCDGWNLSPRVIRFIRETVPARSLFIAKAA